MGERPYRQRWEVGRPVNQIRSLNIAKRPQLRPLLYSHLNKTSDSGQRPNAPAQLRELKKQHGKRGACSKEGFVVDAMIKTRA